MRLVAKRGIQGAHASVLLVFAERSFDKVQDHVTTDFPDEDETDTDEVNPVLNHSPFSQLNANTCDQSQFGNGKETSEQGWAGLW